MPTSPSVHHARSQRHEPPSTTGLGPNDFAFVAEVGVRWSDMDAFGHINHARMVTLMEEARIAWLLSAGEDYAPLITSAMIVHVDIRYQAQLRHDDSPLRIGMWIKGFRSVDFTIGYAIRSVGADSDSRPACVASTQMAVVDIEKHTLRRLSPTEKDYLSTWSRRLVASG
ncbi:thioesterase family protein [Gordonia hongkongensis]|uniref:Thioesterase family protein n=1 Tax=Gordonia hongkongensis TaxID=1701090 RepID=A0AAX3T8D5_9ACTN|nr:thioesterase family protein [Gordonia hongkongensis]OCW84052.1 thioesterase [Nocardia farcinica]QIK49803.1 acyl-CoA thioesterase [Gordonia terrae]WFP25255.1 thioesterase family protein [Gordonia hongkongensis]